MAVTSPPPYTRLSGAASKISTKFSVPKPQRPEAAKRRNMATRKPKSPIRLTMNAFLPESAFSRSVNQYPMRM